MMQKPIVISRNTKGPAVASIRVTILGSLEMGMGASHLFYLWSPFGNVFLILLLFYFFVLVQPDYP